MPIRSVFFSSQKTSYVWRISDWSSDVCSSDLACAAIDHHHLMSDRESDIVAGNGRERLHNTRRDGLSPCRHPGRQCQATAGQRGTAEQIAAVQYRGDIISLVIVQHKIVHSEARAR